MPGVSIASDNQAVIDGSGLVVVSVLPGDADEVLRPLRFRPDQTVLSVMATVSHARIERLIAPASAAVAMMPGQANAYGLGPSILFPDLAEPRAFLERLGPVHALETAELFNSASVFGAFSGLSFLFMTEAINWFTQAGLDPALARALVAGTLIGNAEVVRQSTEPLATIVESVATPGGITEAGAAVLRDRGALNAWTAALDQVLVRIAGKD